MIRIRPFALAAILAAATTAPLAAQNGSVRAAVDRNPPPLPPYRTLGMLSQPDTGQDDILISKRLTGPSPTRVTEVEQHRGRQEVVPRARSIDYSGPRFGVTWLPKTAVDSLKAHNIKVGQTITQYGWQMEHEIHVSEDGPRVLNEWVLLAGGLESGVFLPSFTWLIGARDKAGNEIGVGPNGSIAGVGLAAAAGITFHNGGINFPLNVAVAKSKTGARYSVLTGFTIN
jgi:hypothetical protein